jgi:hypothetical protein
MKPISSGAIPVQQFPGREIANHRVLSLLEKLTGGVRFHFNTSDAFEPYGGAGTGRNGRA